MRESRASGVVCDAVVIEPHEPVHGKRNNDGEDKGMGMAERRRAAAVNGRLDWSEL